jgi:hypothetical protein
VTASDRILQRLSWLWQPRGLVAPSVGPARPIARSRALGPLAGPVPTSPSRRGMLRGVMGGTAFAVGLPWLEIFAGRQAHADTLFPPRFGVWFWGNGNRPDQWMPTGEGYGDDWSLSEELAPLINIKHKLSVLTGMAVKVPNYIPHWSGAGGLLTGMDAVGDDDDWTVQGPTIDQIVANEIGTSTIFKSLEVGLETDSVFSFTGPHARNPGETDPFTLYTRIFGPTFREPGEEGIVDPSLGYRRSVLDAVMQDVSDLQAEVGTEDRRRLEAHLDGIRDLEQRLARLQEDPPDLESCERPTEPEASYPDVDGRVQVSARAMAVHDVMTMALACDQTRVFHFQISKPVSNLLFPGAPDGHHNLTHDEAGTQPNVHNITLQIISELAYFLEQLDSVPEGDETLLDHCCILATSEHGEARTHDIRNIPMLVAGSAGGALAQDMHYRSYSEENAGKVTLTLLRALGINATSWGDEDTYTTDGLPALEV